MQTTVSNVKMADVGNNTRHKNCAPVGECVLLIEWIASISQRTDSKPTVDGFYAPQLYRQVLAVAVMWSVRLSDCSSVTARWYTKPRWYRDSWFSPYDSLESLVSLRGNLVPLDEEIPLERGHQRGEPPPPRNRYFTTIGSSSVKTVADRHRLAAYHNKHCRRAFQWYQHRWPWTTLNPNDRGFSEFLAILGCSTHFKSELRRNHSM